MNNFEGHIKGDKPAFSQGNILWRKNGVASTEEILHHLNVPIA